MGSRTVLVGMGIARSVDMTKATALVPTRTESLHRRKSVKQLQRPRKPEAEADARNRLSLRNTLNHVFFALGGVGGFLLSLSSHSPVGPCVGFKVLGTISSVRLMTSRAAAFLYFPQ